MITEIIDVVFSIGIWSVVFVFYFVFGALFGSWLSRRNGRRDSDNLRWIVLGITIFTFGAFPVTFYCLSIP